VAPVERFGASSEPKELMLRWEGKQIGTSLRLGVGSGTIDVILPPEIDPKASEIHKSISALIFSMSITTPWHPSRDLSGMLRHGLLTPSG